MRKGFVPIVGIELHAQMACSRKLFSPSPQQYGAAPNSLLSYLDIGLPGSLPRLNWDCVGIAVKTGLALGCTIHHDSRFDRKHYFYADLPLGYQITQQYRPICTNGQVDVILRDGTKRKVNISRIHMEQDSGKLMHERDCALLDLNRAGSALMEIVSAPDMRSSDEAVAYVTKIARLLQFIGTCDADLSKGNLRMDVNVSVAREETLSKSLGTRCEIKNLNSLVRMKDAIEYEVDRHIDMMNKGIPIVSETRGWNTQEQRTYSLRDKEASVDYRYMRDGDLPRLLIDEAYVNSIRSTLLETPAERVERYQSKFQLAPFDAEAMALDPPVSRYFEQVMQENGARDARVVCNWISHELTGLMHAAAVFNIEKSPVTPKQLGSLVDALASGAITGKLGKRVIKHMFDHPSQLDCMAILKEQGWDVLRDVSEMLLIAQSVVESGATEAANYRQGDANRKQRMLKYFMGQAMQKTKGRADPEQMRSLIEQVLQERKD